MSQDLRSAANLLMTLAGDEDPATENAYRVAARRLHAEADEADAEDARDHLLWIGAR